MIELTGSVTGISIRRNVSDDVIQKVVLEVFGDTRALHELLKKPVKITIEESK